MSDIIRIRRRPGLWTVRAGGAVLGESDAVLELSEGERPDVFYFPREDLAMAFFEPSPTRTSSAKLGEASFYSLRTKSTLIEDAAWSYEAPPEAAARIAGYVSFDPAKVTVEET